MLKQPKISTMLEHNDKKIELPETDNEKVQPPGTGQMQKRDEIMTNLLSSSDQSEDAHGSIHVHQFESCSATNDPKETFIMHSSNVPTYNVSSREQYFRLFMCLFVPRVSFAPILKRTRAAESFESYENAWTKYVEEKKKGTEEEKDEIRRIEQYLAWLPINHKDLKRLEQEIAENEEEAPEVPPGQGSFERIVINDKHQEDCEKMNNEQKKVYETVMTGLRDQKARKQTLKALEKNNLSNKEKERRYLTIPEAPPVRIKVLGTAGTGKSFLINTLADGVVSKFGKPLDEGDASVKYGKVIIAAPTGMAAVPIKGRTCHSVFGIGVRTRKVPSGSKLANLRELFKDALLIIVDELSMISNEMLARINYHLQVIFDSKELFGGQNLILLGDLMQIPPVGARKVFAPLNDSKFTNHATLFDDEFDLMELNENMRQREDNDFFTVLQHVRTHHKTSQMLKLNDIAKLKTRLLTPSPGEETVSMERAMEHFLHIQKKDPRIMALFPRNREVRMFNELVMRAREKMEEEEANLGSRNGNHNNSNQKEASSSLEIPSATAEKTFTVNDRVMLRKNIDTTKGLVNGATGNVVEVARDDSGAIKTIKVMFDDVAEKTLFTKPRTSPFPLVTAFAATVHKCQGLTLKNVMISTANFFTFGQAFVSFSRVTKFEGLHLIDLDLNKINCDMESLNKYTEMREKSALKRS